jgi:hypothetical protein
MDTMAAKLSRELPFAGAVVSRHSDPCLRLYVKPVENTISRSRILYQAKILFKKSPDLLEK